jgi:hypothetical protein
MGDVAAGVDSISFVTFAGAVIVTFSFADFVGESTKHFVGAVSMRTFAAGAAVNLSSSLVAPSVIVAVDIFVDTGTVQTSGGGTVAVTPSVVDVAVDVSVMASTFAAGAAVNLSFSFVAPSVIVAVDISVDAGTV